MVGTCPPHVSSLEAGGRFSACPVLSTGRPLHLPAEVNTHGNFDLGSSARRQVSALETTTKLRHYRISRIIGHSSSSEASVVVLVAAQPARNRKRIPVKEILKDMGYSFR